VDFETVLLTFVDRLEKEEIRCVIVGGLAVHAWGRSRPTRDADFAVDREHQQRVIALSESLGYRTVFASDAFSNHEHEDPRWGHVDFMYLTGPTATAIFEAAVMKPLLRERQVPVASPEHLAMMKAVAMKNFPHRTLYEGDDVRLLLEVPGVDRDSIRGFFERHGLLELFDAIEKKR
jgi:hypothetical protein